ncbi:MAG: hypothetical protein AAGE88_18125 [Actinomycetota bacterium]
MNTTTDSPTVWSPSTKMLGGVLAPIIGLIVDRITEADWPGFIAALAALVVVYFIPELNGAWVRSMLDGQERASR